MLAILRKRLAAKDGGTTNVELVQGTPTESKLPDGAVDLALMVDVYHELAQPQVFLRSLKRALKSGWAAGADRVPQGKRAGADPRGAQDVGA